MKKIIVSLFLIMLFSLSGFGLDYSKLTSSNSLSLDDSNSTSNDYDLLFPGISLRLDMTNLTSSDSLSLDNSNSINGDYDLSLPGIVLRKGVTATIHCKVYVNPRHRPGLSVLAIHGAGHTAATWEELSKAIFSNNRTGAVIANFIAINMPGRGQSSLPDNILFGDMTLDDYASIVIDVITKLRGYNLRPAIIFAHSMGTMTIMQVQQTLIDRGTSLWRKFGVVNVTLLAPTVPDGMPYELMDSGVGAGLIAQFVTYNPQLGPFIFFPEYVWPMLFFANRMGIPVRGIPSVEAIIARGYNSPEALMMAFQVVGAPPYYTRPVIDESVFGYKKGTILYLVGYENDILLLPQEGKNIFDHLTKSNRYLSKYIFIEGLDAVHDYHLFQAEKLVKNIFGD